VLKKSIFVMLSFISNFITLCYLVFILGTSVEQRMPLLQVAELLDISVA
jgi:hypothetical protein